jgi:hypothetical protein
LAAVAAGTKAGVEEDEAEAEAEDEAGRLSDYEFARVREERIATCGVSWASNGRPVSTDQPQIEEMPMSDSVTTTDHKVIKKWAEERDGRPATVRATEEDGHAGILRIDFGPAEDQLEEIEWDEFFRKFDESDLAFLHQDRTKDGKLSRFHKFVRRE